MGEGRGELSEDVGRSLIRCDKLIVKHSRERRRILSPTGSAPGQTIYKRSWPGEGVEKFASERGDVVAAPRCSSSSSQSRCSKSACEWSQDVICLVP